MISIGIDAGSRTTKIVILDRDTREVLASGLCDQGVDQEAVAKDLLYETLKREGLAERDISKTVATGYGRNLIQFADRNVTEITCQARGVAHQNSDTRMIVEIGGQDSKIIHLNETGRVHDFMMNDRCAAGTGRFLEMVAVRLNTRLDRLDGLAAQSQSAATISSMCVVFAETEIVGLLAATCPPTDIVSGVFRAIAQRVTAMAGKHTEGPVAFTGGVALFEGMRKALINELGYPVDTATHPQYTGALGAALIAAEG